MNNIIYGSGSCAIESTDEIVGLEIGYTGKIKIKDKTSDSYSLISNNNKILIFPIGAVEPLSDLFEYSGEFRITSILGCNRDAVRVEVRVKKLMNYSETLHTNSEDMTEIVSEKLNSGYKHKVSQKNTTVDNKIIKNLRSKGELYLIDRSAYSGPYHVHSDTGKAMTGGEHNQGSQDLYTKAIDGTLVATGTGQIPIR